MVPRLMNLLCDLSDYYQDQGSNADRKLVQKVIKLVDRVWHEAQMAKRPVIKKKPESEAEAFVLTIKDIGVYRDRDGQYMYELDKRHFDTPEEVMQWLVKFRELTLVQRERERIQKARAAEQRMKEMTRNGNGETA